MDFEERQFSTNIFRPRPEVHIDNENGLALICTPWGPREIADQAIQTLRDHFITARSDQEVTMPFDRLSCLSSLANDLRISVKITNDFIFNTVNKNEFTSGIELLAIAKGPTEISLAQAGGPHLVMFKSNGARYPLSSSLDLNEEFAGTGSQLPPLAANLLGVDSTSNFSVQSTRAQEGDQILFVTRLNLPSELFQINPSELNIDTAAHLLAKQDAQMPFWLGLLKI